jgi:hypothetical protein
MFRRDALGCVFLSLASWPMRARAQQKQPAVDALPALSLAIRVVSVDGRDVVTPSFIEEQIETTNKLFGLFGVSFVPTTQPKLASDFAELENREDRNRLSEALVDKQVTVNFVRSLRDVDDPRLYRMGVTWRNLRNLKQRYVIVAGSARPTTLAHELGHYFGLPHVTATNNLMSYDRDGGEVFLDAPQMKTIRTSVAFAQKTKSLI